MRVADFKVKECYINEKGKLIEESYLGLQQESMLKKHENEERQRRARDIANKQKLRAEREQIRELQRSRKTGK